MCKEQEPRAIKKSEKNNLTFSGKFTLKKKKRDSENKSSLLFSQAIISWMQVLLFTKSSG